MSRTVEDDKYMPWKLIVLSIIVGIFFSILPFPYWALWLTPELPLMIMIYWVITFPFRFGMIFSGLVGLLVDILDGGILGQNALAFVVISYLSLLFYTQLKMFNIILQSLCVFFFVLLYQLIIFWIFSISGGDFNSIIFATPALTSMFFWPIVKFILNRVNL